MSFNLAVILSETAHSAPDRPVAAFAQGRVTYRELDQASDRLAASLAGHRGKARRPVALQLPNIPQFLISYFGILKAGGIVVPLNVLLKAPEVAFHLGDSGARVLITWEGVLAEAARGGSRRVERRSTPSATPATSGGAPFERLLRRHRAAFRHGRWGSPGHGRDRLHLRHDGPPQGRRAHAHPA